MRLHVLPGDRHDGRVPNAPGPADEQQDEPVTATPSTPPPDAPECVRCDRQIGDDEERWKCCPEHTSGATRDVVCADCAAALHPELRAASDQPPVSPEAKSGAAGEGMTVASRHAPAVLFSDEARREAVAEAMLATAPLASAKRRLIVEEAVNVALSAPAVRREVEAGYEAAETWRAISDRNFKTLAAANADRDRLAAALETAEREAAQARAARAARAAMLAMYDGVVAECERKRVALDAALHRIEALAAVLHHTSCPHPPEAVRVGSHDQMPYCSLCQADVDVPEVPHSDDGGEARLPEVPEPPQ